MADANTGRVAPAVRAKAAVLRRRAASGSMWFGVEGNSMGRSLAAGSEVRVVARRHPRRDEIWAFCQADGKMLVHRYRGGGEAAHVFQGDASSTPDEPVGAELLIGRVVAVRENGRVRRVGARRWPNRWAAAGHRVETRMVAASRWMRARFAERRSSGAGVDDDVGGADGDGVGEQAGELLPADDRGAFVRESRSGHERSSDPRGDPEMVTGSAVLRGCTVELLGLATRLSADDARGADALASVLGGARRSDAAAVVHVRACSSAPPVPSTTADRVTTEFETWRPRRGELVLRHRSGLTARATRTAIDVGGVADPPAAHFRRVCINALAHLLAAHDRFVVHGAAIARKGQAILVLGGTGAGKSTVAACALRAGWEVLADDLVVLRDGQPAPLLGGVPRPLAVPPEVPTDDHLDARLVPGDVRGRRELPGHVVTRGSYPLSGSIAVGHGEHARGTLEPIEAHALLRMLLASWAPIESPDDLRRIFPIAASVARRPATRLSLGRDPATRVPDTVDLLDEARAQLARS